MVAPPDPLHASGLLLLLLSLLYSTITISADREYQSDNQADVGLFLVLHPETLLRIGKLERPSTYLPTDLPTYLPITSLSLFLLFPLSCETYFINTRSPCRKVMLFPMTRYATIAQSQLPPSPLRRRLSGPELTTLYK